MSLHVKSRGGHQSNRRWTSCCLRLSESWSNKTCRLSHYLSCLSGPSSVHGQTKIKKLALGVLFIAPLISPSVAACILPPPLPAYPLRHPMYPLRCPVYSLHHRAYPLHRHLHSPSSVACVLPLSPCTPLAYPLRRCAYPLCHCRCNRSAAACVPHFTALYTPSAAAYVPPHH